MKKLCIFIISLILLSALSYAEEFIYFEKEKNSWLQIYSNQLKAQSLEEEIRTLEKSIKKSNGKERVELEQLLQLQTSKKKILDELPQSFDSILEKITIESKTKEIGLIEYIFKNRKNKFDIQFQRLNLLQQEYNSAVNFIKKELELVEKQEIKEPQKEHSLQKAIYFFENAKGLLDNKADVLKRTKDNYLNDLKAYEQTQLPIFVAKVAILILIFLLFSLIKYFIIKRVEDEESLFKTKKVLNIIFFLTILLIIVIFNINNIVYAATLIGVIAAAMTISMKEYLQSIASWFHLSFGDFIKVGDRILINVNNTPIIGEVINISLFKVTLYESINNTTSLQLKRAGRTVFIPNNFFVTNYVYNYTHDKIKTIYDLIEFRIPFNSDTQKIEKLVTEITYEMTDKYIEITSKQFLSFKKRYDMRSRDFRPRIHLIADQKEPCFILYVWYTAPYHQIMELKSQLSQKIVKRLQEEGVKFYAQSID